MADGMQILGTGTIKWSFHTTANKLMVIHSRCYYVPKSKARLISPQRLFNKKRGITGSFTVTEDCASLTYDGVGTLKIDYDSGNHLPIALGKNLASVGGGNPMSNLSIMDESNQNLTPSQRLLLHWHARFGHKSFSSLQRLF